MPGHGSKVIVSIAGGTKDEKKKKEEYGRLHLRLDITSGRCPVVIIIVLERTHIIEEPLIYHICLTTNVVEAT